MFVRTGTRNRISAKFTSVSKFALLFSLVALSAPATARVPPILVVDDFTTGPVSFGLNGAGQKGPLYAAFEQQGSHILGGWRGTSLSLTLPNNIFRQNANAQIMPKTDLAPAAAVFSEGLLADAVFGIGYGTGAGPKGKPLNVDLTPYDRFRVEFYQASGVGFIILAFSASGYTEWGCNINALYQYNKPPVLFKVDFPFVNGKHATTSQANLAEVQSLVYETESNSAAPNAFAITKIEFVRASEPPGDITCPPIGGQSVRQNILRHG